MRNVAGVGGEGRLENWSHLAVDTLDTVGLLLVVWATAASVQDRVAARALLWRLLCPRPRAPARPSCRDGQLGDGRGDDPTSCSTASTTIHPDQRRMTALKNLPG
jgi:hypothetical protein